MDSTRSIQSTMISNNIKPTYAGLSDSRVDFNDFGFDAWDTSVLAHLFPEDLLLEAIAFCTLLYLCDIFW